MILDQYNIFMYIYNHLGLLQFMTTFQRIEFSLFVNYFLTFYLKKIA